MMMGMSKANLQTTRNGFSTVELVIVATILTIVTSFGVMGISRAKASVRLSGAAREYASYIERARLYSIRSHAETADERANVVINDDKLSYNVSMDLDGDGVLDTRTIPLPSGVRFDVVQAETIGFDWRGRTWNTAGATTRSNAQVSITLTNDIDRVSVDVTGSGDVTIDSAVFDDEVPNVHLNIGDLASSATSTSTPVSTSTPAASPSPTATPASSPLATPTPDPGTGLSGNATPTPTPSSTPTPTPTPRATPTPRPTATPTPTPEVCTVATDQILLLLHLDGSTTIKVSHSSSNSQTISASSSKSSDLQVSPNNQSVSAGGTATFTVKSKKSIGVYSVTFTTGCGSKTVPVTVIL
jgi:hypothetical protein